MSQQTKHPRVLADDSIREIADRRTAAQTEIHQLCAGHHSFRMSIPVQLIDSDELLSQALADSARLEQEIYRLRADITSILYNTGELDFKSPAGELFEQLLWGTTDELAKQQEA